MSGDKNGVSILVLLDILLQLNIPQYPSQHHYRFNPCFIGYTSATKASQKVKRGDKNVSILVLLDILLQQENMNSIRWI